MTGKQQDNERADASNPQRTDSGRDQQAEQQRMNAQAQQQAASRPGQRTIRDSQGNDIPFFPAPAGHASDSMTRNAQRAREQERTQAKVDVPGSATPEAVAGARVTSMPPGGLQALALLLFPDDVDDQEAMDNHMQDLLNLNRDTLRDDTSHMAGQVVRIPG